MRFSANQYKFFVLTIIFFFNLSCQKSAPSSSELSSEVASLITPEVQTLTPLKNGSWGAPQVNLSVNESGIRIDFGCANASIDHQVLVNENGEFESDGTYQFAGGALPIGGFPTQRIKFHGLVKANSLILDYSFPDSTAGSNPGIYHVEFVYGLVSELMYCP